MAKLRAERAIATKKLEDIDAINHRLSVLFGLDKKPHERGKLLESILGAVALACIFIWLPLSSKFYT